MPRFEVWDCSRSAMIRTPLVQFSPIIPTSGRRLNKTTLLVAMRFPKFPVQRGQQMSARLQPLPVDAALERGGGAVDRLLVEGFGYQHHADRQAVDHAARQAHC